MAQGGQRLIQLPLVLDKSALWYISAKIVDVDVRPQRPAPRNSSRTASDQGDRIYGLTARETLSP
jgi:hypothetical protein